MAKNAYIKRMRGLVTMFFCVVDGAHVAHLNTRSFAAHEALGEFYSFASGFKDRMIEYMIGQGYVGQIVVNPIDGNSDVVEEAQAAFDALYEIADEYDECTLENMAADFKEALGKLKYMLMFK